ncbi:M24 family metallopeptidase [Bradyrhizobium sp. DOA9]|uniref:M24 family metallopeptidase n=1 Tax=Bradyrhizobium sp. DOA9 TaxID=1126627 RepID=UPI000468B667|nr:Xaa-Pro peptidase family protein [Bradyrhizobium sp. DOA9]GAJ37605.1 xaa-Pro dipeptidase [Bradyrhizobium sp. DOA9]
MTVSPLPFTTDEYKARQTRLRARLEERGVDALLISSPENMFYLTGYDTTGFHSFPQVLVFSLKAAPTLFTRQYEVETANKSCFNLTAVGYSDNDGPSKAIVDFLEMSGLASQRLSLEKNVPWLRVSVYEALNQLLPNAKWLDGSGIIEEIRAVKSAAEQAYLRQAGRAASAGMRAAIGAIRPGVLDSEIAAASYQARLAAGSHHIRTPTYIVTGPRSALAHQTWNGSAVGETDIVFMELGANVRHYSAASIHSVLVGPVDDKLKRASHAVLEARTRAVEQIRPGVAAEEVHAATCAALKKAGFLENLRSRTGYGIGIEFLVWIESGGLSLFTGDRRVIMEGMSFHVLPHIALPGLGTVGFSQTVICTAGSPEIITEVPVELQ